MSLASVEGLIHKVFEVFLSELNKTNHTLAYVPPYNTDSIVHTGYHPSRSCASSNPAGNQTILKADS